MTPELRALAHSQHGLVTRTQARKAGYTERQLKTRLQPRGAWVAVRRGVYVERWEWDGADDASRHRLRVIAAAMTAQAPYVLSHSSAAVAHGLACRPYWRELVHLSHPRVLGGRTEGGVKHHPAHVPANQIVVVDGYCVTSQARTAVDVAREHGLEDGVAICDQVLRRGCRREELAAVLEQMRCWPNVTRARSAVALADPGAENIGESLARMLVLELGYGAPRTQVWVEEGDRRARVDMLLDQHVFEFDGKHKLVPVERGGFALDPVEALWQEKLREDWLRSLGLGVSRIVWADLFGVARRASRDRLMREYLATRARRVDPLGL